MHAPSTRHRRYSLHCLTLTPPYLGVHEDEAPCGRLSLPEREELERSLGHPVPLLGGDQALLQDLLGRNRLVVILRLRVA